MRADQRVICVMGRPLDQDDGIGVYTSNLLHNMLELDTASSYVILLRTPKHARDFDAYPHAETKVVPARRKLWWDQVVVPREARRARANIIFNPKFSLPLFSRIPGVFVLHGSDWYVNPQNYTWWDNLYIRAMLPLYCRKAARLLAISDVAVRDTVKYAGIDGTKVTPTYAAPADHFKPIEDQESLDLFRERHGLPDRFILTVARAYHTGHGQRLEYPGGNNETLLLGYRRYRAAGGTLPLVVIGRDIERYLRRRGFTDENLADVYFTGFIPNQDIALAYCQADFFILCTLYESFPLPVTEALATGCPAILPVTGGCRDLAGDAARYVDPLDADAVGRAMFEMEQSPELRETLRRKGLTRIREFTWRKTAERTLNVLAAVSRAESGSVA